MKKAYVLPKAEKMAFDYSDVVVASNGQCTNTTTVTLYEIAEGSDCYKVVISHDKNNVA